MTKKFIDLIKNFEDVKNKKSQTNKNGRTYKRVDCTSESIKKAYENINNGVCLQYLENKNRLDLDFPLVEQDFLC